MRKNLGRALLLVATAIVLLCGVGFFYAIGPIRIDHSPVEFEITQGLRLRSVSVELEKAGVRVGAMRFELLGRALRRAEDIKAGSYEITEPISPLELLDRITRGDQTLQALTVPEGWTFAQFREALAARTDLRQESAEMSAAEVRHRLGIDAAHLEGRFFPDTYHFARGTGDLAILRRAARSMQRHLATEWEGREAGLPVTTPEQALTLASIIEKETGRADERRRIAGVLINRLRIGMLLQVDPTVIYGLGDSFDGNLRKADLLRDGPYNTYQRAGLPPTPISLPGLASLRASLHPEKTDALYYVSRGDGTSQFSRTLDEHNRAVARYQRRARAAAVR